MAAPAFWAYGVAVGLCVRCEELRRLSVLNLVRSVLNHLRDAAWRRDAVHLVGVELGVLAALTAVVLLAQISRGQTVATAGEGPQDQATMTGPGRAGMWSVLSARPEAAGRLTKFFDFEEFTPNPVPNHWFRAQGHAEAPREGFPPTNQAELDETVAAGGKVSLRPAANNLELATLTLPTLAKGSVTTAIALGDISPVAGARFLSFLLVNDLDFKATPAAIEIPAGTTGQILLVHAAPGVPAVSLGLKGAASALTGVAYKTASKLTSLPAGNGDVELRPAMGNPLLTVSARFLPALSWTLVAVGKSGGTGADAPQLRAFPRLSVPTDLGTGNLRFVHAALGVPSVDVLAGAMPLFSGVAFGQATAVKVQTLSDALKALLTGTGLVVNQAGSMTRLFGVKLSPGAYAALDGAGVSVVATGINKDANNPAAVLAVVETDATTMRAATTIELTVAP